MFSLRRGVVEELLVEPDSSWLLVVPGVVFTNPKRFDRATLAYPGTLSTALRRFLDDPPIDGESWIWWL